MKTEKERFDEIEELVDMLLITSVMGIFFIILTILSFTVIFSFV